MWQLSPFEVIIETCHSKGKCLGKPKYAIADYFRSYATIRNG